VQGSTAGAAKTAPRACLPARRLVKMGSLSKKSRQAATLLKLKLPLGLLLFSLPVNVVLE
jgi:hypothetical protein